MSESFLLRFQEATSDQKASVLCGTKTETRQAAESQDNDPGPAAYAAIPISASDSSRVLMATRTFTAVRAEEPDSDVKHECYYAIPKCS